MSSLTRRMQQLLPTFVNHIPHVVIICPKEKMIGPNARRVVATVQDKEPIGYCPKS